MNPAIILNIAYAVLIGATRTRTVRWLRVTLIAGAALFVTYGAIVGITSMVVWNSAIGGLHLSRLLADLYTERSAKLEPEARKFRDRLMPELSDANFLFLWNNSQEAVHLDTPIVEAGELPEHLSLIVAGRVDITHRGVPKFQRGDATVIGGVSFMSCTSAGFGVVASGAVSVRQWDIDWLRVLHDHNPACAQAVLQLVGRDLAAQARLLPLLVPGSTGIAA